MMAKCACGKDLFTTDTDGICTSCRNKLSSNISLFGIDLTSQKGWECPKCGRIYAPYVPECHICNHDKPITGITGG